MAIRYEVRALFTNGDSVGTHDTRPEALHVYGRTLITYSSEKTLLRCEVWEVDTDVGEVLLAVYQTGGLRYVAKISSPVRSRVNRGCNPFAARSRRIRERALFGRNT